MIPSNAYGENFVRFVDRVFSTASLAIYREDALKLLFLLHKCKQEGEAEWYAAKMHPLSNFCGYLLAKMSYDVRVGSEQELAWFRYGPDWLKALAGFEDDPGRRACEAEGRLREDERRSQPFA